MPVGTRTMPPPRPFRSFRPGRTLAVLAGAGIAIAAGAAEPPVITRQPTDQIAKHLADVTFTVRATGTKPLTYLWHRNGQTFPGWDKPSITLRSVTENDLGQYSVTVSNATGSVTSENVRLTLTGAKSPASAAGPAPPASPRPAPAARAGTGAPAAVAVERMREGERLQLEATADSAAPLRFQWLKDGRPIRGATASRFEIARVTPADAGLYVCIVANAAGERPSLPILLEVNPR